jgi:hypothetical protein
MAWGPLSGSSSQVIVSAGSAASNPEDISGLVLWLESGKGITLNGSDVSNWSDTTSGNTNDFAQGTAANQPTLTAGTFDTNPSLDFDGINDGLLRADTSTLDCLLGDPWYWIMRFETTATVSVASKVYLGKIASHSGWYFGHRSYSGAKFAMQAQSTGPSREDRYIATDTTIAINTKYTLEFYNTGTGMGTGFRIAVNGVEETMVEQYHTIDGSVPILNDGLIGVGMRGDSLGQTAMNIGVVGFYSEIPSTDDRIVLRDYITENYP